MKKKAIVMACVRSGTANSVWQMFETAFLPGHFGAVCGVALCWVPVLLVLHLGDESILGGCFWLPR